MRACCAVICVCVLCVRFVRDVCAFYVCVPGVFFVFVVRDVCAFLCVLFVAFCACCVCFLYVLCVLVVL